MARFEQGTVVVNIDIGPSGTVSRCTVTQSVSPTLDAKTCAIITNRATYRPARDRKGQAIASTDTVRIRWVLPAVPDRKFVNAWRQVIATVSADGTQRCASSASLPLPPIDQWSCDILVNANAPYRPGGIARPFIMTIREEQTIDRTIPTLITGSNIARVIVRQRIAADGTVTACERVPDLSPAVDDKAFFDCRINARFERLPDSAPNRGERVLTVAWMRSFDTAVDAPPR
jgi:TonB family protein